MIDQLVIYIWVYNTHRPLYALLETSLAAAAVRRSGLCCVRFFFFASSPEDQEDHVCGCWIDVCRSGTGGGCCLQKLGDDWCTGWRNLHFVSEGRGRGYNVTGNCSFCLRRDSLCSEARSTMCVCVCGWVKMGCRMVGNGVVGIFAKWLERDADLCRVIQKVSAIHGGCLQHILKIRQSNLDNSKFSLIQIFPPVPSIYTCNWNIYYIFRSSC